MSDKKLSTQNFRNRLAEHFENQPELLRGEKARKQADGMAEHFSNGEQMLADASATLRDIAESHPDPEKRKAADLAIKKLDDAATAFSIGATCAGAVWNADET